MVMLMELVKGDLKELLMDCQKVILMVYQKVHDMAMKEGIN